MSSQKVSVIHESKPLSALYSTKLQFYLQESVTYGKRNDARWKSCKFNCLAWHRYEWLSHLSMRTRAGMPPDLKMDKRPSRWWERLWRMLAVHLAVSMSLVLCMVRTTAATICGDCIRTRRDASLRDSWFTIMAALFTTTCPKKWIFFFALKPPFLKVHNP